MYLSSKIQYDISGIVVDPLEVHFLPLGKSNIQSFWGKVVSQIGAEWACVLAAISEYAGCLIYPEVKNENPVGPQQLQIHGIENTFFAN